MHASKPGRDQSLRCSEEQEEQGGRCFPLKVGDGQVRYQAPLAALAARVHQHDGSSHPAYTLGHPMPTSPDTENRDGTSRASLDAAEGTQPPSIHSRCDARLASCQRSIHNFFSKQ